MDLRERMEKLAVQFVDCEPDRWSGTFIAAKLRELLAAPDDTQARLAAAEEFIEEVMPVLAVLSYKNQGKLLPSHFPLSLGEVREKITDRLLPLYEDYRQRFPKPDAGEATARCECGDSTPHKPSECCCDWPEGCKHRRAAEPAPDVLRERAIKNLYYAMTASGTTFKRQYAEESIDAIADLAAARLGRKE
jgi:hypothetical protein